MFPLLLLFILLVPVLAAPSSSKLVYSCTNNSNCKWINVTKYCKSFSNYYTFDTEVLVQGDMILPQNNERNAMTHSNRLWPNGKVPYKIKNYSSDARKTILNVMSIIEQNTCIQFVPQTTEISYLSVENIQNGCFSDVGRKLNLPTLLNLAETECLESATMFHEMLHSLGLFHEQSRFDRDDHINILWENVDPNHLFDFCLLDWASLSTYGLQYDLNSVMHYEKNAFSKNGKPTMEPKISYRMGLFGSVKSPSPIDYEKLRRMYQCPKHYN